MTAKTAVKTFVLTSVEIEQRRELGDWKKQLESIDASKKAGSTSSADPLINFLWGEAKLELWLEEHQPSEKFISKAKTSLIDIKKTILLCLNQSSQVISSARTDAHLLLAKILHASGLYEESLEELEKSSIDAIDMPSAPSVRNLQLLADAYAIKGFCVEKVGRSWRGTKSMTDTDRRNLVLSSFQKCSEFAIAYFQGLEEKGQVEKKVSSLLDYALRRFPSLLLEDGNTEGAINGIRRLLRSKETNIFSPTRLLLYRRLAEILLRYKFNEIPLLTSNHVKFYIGGKLFSPQNIWEDIFLVLLLSESMAVRDGVLNQSPEFVKARKLANLNATSIFDLLTLGCARWGLFAIINESLEKSLKFSFEEPHVWAQYGLTFHAANVNSRRSTETLLEAARVSKRPTALYLLAAKELFTHGNTKGGMEVLRRAEKFELAGLQRLLQRVYLYKGIGLFLHSFEMKVHRDRIQCFLDALDAFNSSANLDPLDYMTSHWQARTYAYMNNVQEAFNCAVKTLKAYPFHLPTLQLIVLLLSAQRNYNDALAITEEALDEYPDHLGMLQLRSHLEEVVEGPETALATIKQMLIIWKRVFEDVGNRSESPDFKTNYSNTLQLPSPTTDKETMSVASYRGAASVTGSSSNTNTLTAGFRAESALSEIASSISVHGSLSASTSGDMAWNAQITIWLMLSELYLKMDMMEQAGAALEEAATINVTNPDVLWLRGQLQENPSLDYHEARSLYESAVAVRPTHIKSLQSLALMQHYFGSHRLAEKTLNDALKIDPYDYITWYNLGKVLEALGECAEAGDCMATALDIESCAPILPYSIVPISFE